jgi:hypothetical protein
LIVRSWVLRIVDQPVRESGSLEEREMRSISIAVALAGSAIAVSAAVAQVQVGTTYGVYTGLATGTGGLVLIEPTAPPVRTDIRTFGDPPSLINDYLPLVGSTVRTVIDAQTILNVLTGEGFTTFTVSGTNPTTGMPMELFPSGLSSGGNPLTRAGFGLGLGLPPSLGGADPVNWTVGSIINAATLTFRNSTTNTSISLSLPVASFFPGNLTGNWNGVFGVSVGGAVGQGYDTVELKLDFIPTPGALALVGLGGLVAARRRRA